MELDGEFNVTSWTEEPATGLEGTVKVTVATIGERFSGGIEADTIADMVMTYLPEGTAEFTGYHRVVGHIGERLGTFVLRATGIYDRSQATTNFEVVADSGTGDLNGLAGSGKADAGHGGTGCYHFDLNFPTTV